MCLLLLKRESELLFMKPKYGLEEHINLMVASEYDLLERRESIKP